MNRLRIFSRDVQTTLYVINPFYMDMRAQYVAPGAEIQYYLCEFENDVLSFEDFRQKVIGATDPAKAAPGTLRANALKDYKALNLPKEPFTSFNVVHGSASPLEAMAERLNWCDLEVKQDAFGAALLQAGIPEATIKEWSRDATVTYNGKNQSIFDLMEEKSAQEVLEIARAIVGVTDGDVPTFTTNSAFVFVKPGATTPETLAMVSKTLTDAKITIAGEGSLKAQVIDEKKLIDNHYYAIANKAVLSHPRTIQITAEAKEKFQKAFNAEWDNVLEMDILVNAREVCGRRNMKPDELSKQFRALAPENSVKLGGGFYVAKMQFA
jgi:nucleoside diphosphate kinase